MKKLDIQEAIDIGVQNSFPTMTVRDIQEAIDEGVNNAISKYLPSNLSDVIYEAIYDATKDSIEGTTITNKNQ